MVIRLIDNTSVVQMDLLEWGTQTHAPGAVKRVEQRRRDERGHEQERRPRREQFQDSDTYVDFEGALRSVILRERPLRESVAQLALPGMEAVLDQGEDAADPRGHQLDLEA